MRSFLTHSLTSSSRYLHKTSRIEKPIMLWLYCSVIWFIGAGAVVGLALWSEKNQVRLHRLLLEKNQLSHQVQWMRGHEAEFSPYINRLQMPPEGLLDVTDRAVEWLQFVGHVDSDLSWGESDLLMLSGSQTITADQERLMLTRHPMSIKTTITNEDKLLLFLASADRVLPEATDLRSCQIQRALQPSALDLRCNMIVLSLPAKVEIRAQKPPSVLERTTSMSRR